MKSEKRHIMTLTIVSVFLFLAANSRTASAQLTFRGYLENRFFATVINNDFAFSHLKNSIRAGDFNRARIIMENEVSENSSITVAVDYFTYHGFLLRNLRNEESGNDPVSAISDDAINVDRAYIKLYFPKADVTIGKQLISWGRSFLWSPFDIFTRANAFDPGEEQSGVNAFRVKVPLGSLAHIEWVYEVNDKFADSRSGMRLLWNWGSTEFAGTVVRNTGELFRQTISGFEFKADVGISVWAEGAYVRENAVVTGTFPKDSFSLWTFGADYSFDVGKVLYVMAEYARDNGGTSNKNNYDFQRVISGRSSFLGKDYLYGSASLQYSDLLSLGLSSFANLNDGGFFLAPNLNYLVFPDTELTFGAFLPVAEKGTEYNIADFLDPNDYAGNSVIYIWLKLYI